MTAKKHGVSRVTLVALIFIALAGMAIFRWPDIAFEMGYAYENGFHNWSRTDTTHYSKAAYWFDQAARAHHPRAQYRLGILYAHGWGVSQDQAQAVQWFIRASQLGYAPARYHLAWLYHKGEGVSHNDLRATELFEEAARADMAAACMALGRMYQYGDGIKPDALQALKYYLLAEHMARFRPEINGNGAYVDQARIAGNKLSSRLPQSSLDQARAFVRMWLQAQTQQTSL